MKSRERISKGPPSADLLVCFPSRAHLTLMPKPICSPARASSESTTRRHHHHHHHHLKKSIKRAGSAGQASPSLWAKTKPTASEIAEPTSPKVTCAGQIKVPGHKPNSSKNWQSVMEEIEKLHNSRKQKKKHTWGEALGFKKEVTQFLTCLRSIRLDFRCFGSSPSSDITSDDDDDDDNDEDIQHNHTRKMAADDDNEASRAVFSKWFMVLQENQSKDFTKSDHYKDPVAPYNINNEEADDHHAPCAPPPNALLLMRCRSAPAKTWLEEREEEEEDKENDEEDEEEEKQAQLVVEEERKKRKENLVVMRYNTDFARFSTDPAKETWVVDGTRDPLSRSRSWKR